VISRRWFGLGLIALGSGIKPALALPGAFDAVVGSADAPGVRSFPDIQSAYLAAPIEGNRPYRILIGPGLWRERLIIERPNIHLIGTDRASTILSYDLAAGMKGADGKPVGTWGCASIIVKAPGFHASDLTISERCYYIPSRISHQRDRP
jgi:pectinesterase